MFNKNNSINENKGGNGNKCDSVKSEAEILRDFGDIMGFTVVNTKNKSDEQIIAELTEEIESKINLKLLEYKDMTSEEYAILESRMEKYKQQMIQYAIFQVMNRAEIKQKVMEKLINSDDN